MPHEVSLITTIAASLGLAMVLGFIAARLKLPPLVGYLLAGVVIGPFTPGYIADQNLANELAELGIILLMFGVGLHFHVGDLLAVRNVAITGALVQSTIATLLGFFHDQPNAWPTNKPSNVAIVLCTRAPVIATFRTASRSPT